jgi:hypothetical protein
MASEDSSKMTKKRFINILYENQPVDIDMGPLDHSEFISSSKE